MHLRWNGWSLSAFRIATQSPPPLRKRLVNRLRFAFVFVKTSGAFPTPHLALAQPKQDGGNVITPSVCLLQRIANINGDIDADLIDQSQRAHRHPPLHQRMVDFFCVHSAFEQLGRVEQIRKQNAIHEEPRAVADNYGQFPDLPRKCDCALARVVRSLFGNDNFHQLHPAHWIEKMQTDDVFGRDRHVGQLANGKRGCVRGDDCFWTRLHCQLAKDFLFDVDFFGGGLDNNLHVAQFHRRGGGYNPGTTLFCFFLRHQAALHSVGVSLLDISKAVVDLLSRDIAQDHGDTA